MAELPSVTAGDSRREVASADWFHSNPKTHDLLAAFERDTAALPSRAGQRHRASSRGSVVGDLRQLGARSSQLLRKSGRPKSASPGPRSSSTAELRREVRQRPPFSPLPRSDSSWRVSPRNVRYATQATLAHAVQGKSTASMTPNDYEEMLRKGIAARTQRARVPAHCGFCGSTHLKVVPRCVYCGSQRDIDMPR